MTVTLPLIFLLPALHFVWDFVLQSHKMACNKSKHFGYLWLHVSVYSTWAMFTGDWRVVWWVYSTHLFIDLVTSRITSRLWDLKQFHYFFVVIGLDQLIHIVTVFFILQRAGFELN